MSLEIDLNMDAIRTVRYGIAELRETWLVACTRRLRHRFRLLTSYQLSQKTTLLSCDTKSHKYVALTILCSSPSVQIMVTRYNTTKHICIQTKYCNMTHTVTRDQGTVLYQLTTQTIAF